MGHNFSYSINKSAGLRFAFSVSSLATLPSLVRLSPSDTLSGFWGMQMRFLFIFSFVALSGCGVAYISPSVQENPEASASSPSVVVVPLTVAVATQANRSAFSPKRLPKIFSQVTPIPSTRQSPALPSPVLNSVDRPRAVETRIPPKLAKRPYLIGIADVLLLATPTATSTVEQLSGLLAAQNKRQGYTVQDDGAIAIPDVGRVQVGGLTLDEAEAEIFQALVKNQFTPSFSLEIAEFNSQRVSIGGAVAKPTLVPISLKPLLLGEALQIAGGITAADQDYTTIRLYRGGKLYQIPLTNFLANSKYQSIQLTDQDSIYVDISFDLAQAQAFFSEQIQLVTLTATARSQALSQLQSEFTIRSKRADELRSGFQARVALDAVARDYVYLAGEVATQGRFTLPFERKAVLADALFSQAGIATREGNVSQIYLLRGNQDGTQVTAYQLDASNIANMMIATRMELRPGDILFVAEQPVTKWNRAISQIGPSIIAAAVK
jgi:polysaccharide biosynthesis/export protein